MGKKPLCYVGMHKWRQIPNLDGDKYVACVNCGKEQTTRVRVIPSGWRYTDKK